MAAAGALALRSTTLRPRFVPLQRLASRTEPHNPAGPIPPVWLRPQGFAPSRRLAPRATCRACFISVPLLGFPFEALTPSVVPYALSDAAALGFLAATSRLPPPPQGLEHTTESPSADPGFSRAPRAGASLGFPLRGFLLAGLGSALPELAPSRPSPHRPRADLLGWAPGFLDRRSAADLSRDWRGLLGVFHLVGLPAQPKLQTGQPFR